MSITKDQLIQFIEKPGLLKEQTIGDLKEILLEFPYFQTAQLLYTYNLFTRDNFRYEAYLKTCSIYATDRTALYRLLQHKSIPNLPAAQKSQAEIREQGSSALLEFSDDQQIDEANLLADQSLEMEEDQTVDFDLLSFEQTDNLIQLDESEDINNMPDEIATIDSITEDKVDLIAQFIKVNPTIQPRTEAPATQKEPLELRDDEEYESDEFITETLARIYLKQGHYQKAIDAFNRLSLKFPEKIVYFAEQIEEIKKLLN